MSIDTPGPSGNPDWYSVPGFAGNVLVNALGGPVSNQSWGPFYVGDANSVYFTQQVSSIGVNYSFEVFWGTSQTLGVGNLFGEVYQGTATCAIIDALPVVAPYVSFQLVASGGNVNFNLQAVSCQANAQGAVGNLSSRACIAVDSQNGPAGTTTSFPGAFLSPGTYSYSIFAVSALTGQLRIAGVPNGGTNSTLVRIISPAGLTSYNGLLVVGDIQPVFQINNTGAGAATASCSLTGPI